MPHSFSFGIQSNSKNRFDLLNNFVRALWFLGLAWMVWELRWWGEKFRSIEWSFNDARKI